MMVDDPKFRGFLEKEKFALNKIRRQFQFAKDYQNIAVDPPRWQNIRNLTSRVSEDFDVNRSGSLRIRGPLPCLQTRSLTGYSTTCLTMPCATGKQ